MMFLQPVFGEEESAHIRCWLSVVRDADASTCTGLGRAYLKATSTYSIKLNDK